MFSKMIVNLAFVLLIAHSLGVSAFPHRANSESTTLQLHNEHEENHYYSHFHPRHYGHHHSADSFEDDDYSPSCECDYYYHSDYHHPSFNSHHDHLFHRDLMMELEERGLKDKVKKVGQSIRNGIRRLRPGPGYGDDFMEMTPSPPPPPTPIPSNPRRNSFHPLAPTKWQRFKAALGFRGH
ncbi:hypothetical protein C8Q75DRAFT_896306 [Abortiporus biennis]|nr:hypothetical protein C8Q75DRAFT_896306 [Abortiporus biennis]